MAEHRRPRGVLAALAVAVLVAGGCGSNKVVIPSPAAKKAQGSGGAIRTDTGGPLGTKAPTFNFTAPTIKPPTTTTIKRRPYRPYHRVRR